MAEEHHLATYVWTAGLLISTNEVIDTYPGAIP